MAELLKMVNLLHLCASYVN